MYVDRVVLNGVRNAEVDEFEPALHHDKVGGLEVGVYDVKGVYSCYTLKHLLPNVPCKCNVEFTRFFVDVWVQDLLEIPFANVHKDTEDFPLFVYLKVVQTDHAINILKLPEELNFTLETANCQFVKVFERHRFHGEELEVLRHDPVDPSAATSANTFHFRELLAVYNYHIATFLL